MASLPDSQFDQDILEIPKFTDEDLKGLIFIAQRKLETVARELKELKTVQKEEVEKALNVSFYKNFRKIKEMFL